jgi:hypothetical protein
MSSRLFLPQLIFDPEDGGDTSIRDVGACMDYTTLYPRMWQILNSSLLGRKHKINCGPEMLVILVGKIQFHQNIARNLSS